jgi:hypothetical protein
MMRALTDNSISQTAFQALSPQAKAANTKILRGNFVNIDRPQYTESYGNLITRVQVGMK